MSNMVAGDFDYSSVDADTAEKLEYFATSGKALIRKSQIEFIAKFGELLSEAKQLLSHSKTGTFVKWSTAEFDLSIQTIYNYINAWDKYLSNGWKDYLNWTPTALYLASADDFPKPVMKKLEKLPSTNLIRTSDVKRLIEASKPKPDPDDPPFDGVPETTASKAAAKAAEKKAAEDKKEAEKKRKEVEKEAARVAKEKEKEKAKADKAAEKEAKKKKEAEDKAKAKEARKATAKADREAAKDAARAQLPNHEHATLIKNEFQQHINRAVVLVDELGNVKPIQHEKKMVIIRTLQAIKLW